MLIIRNNILPLGKSYAAINLFGILFVKRDVRITPELVNHERIHTYQQRELLFIIFYVVYVLEWLGRLVLCGGNGYRAYKSLSFEREAYAHGDDLGYLARRRAFAQWRQNNDGSGPDGSGAPR